MKEKRTKIKEKKKKKKKKKRKKTMKISTSKVLEEAEKRRLSER